MKLQQKFELATYIASKDGVEYEWGVNDCNTFVFEFHDQAYGTNLMALCKYRDKRAAMKFSKGYTTLNQWMMIHNYKAKPKTGKKAPWQEGDIAIQTIKNWYNAAFLYHNGVFWSMNEKTGFGSYTVKAVQSVMTSAWYKAGPEVEIEQPEIKEVEVEAEPVFKTPKEAEEAPAEEEDWLDNNTCTECNEFPCECDRPKE